MQIGERPEPNFSPEPDRVLSLPSVFRGRTRPQNTSTKRRRTVAGRARVVIRDILCMPFSTPQQEDNSWKAPRGQDKEKLASVGLTGKLNLDSTWNSQEVQHEIRSLFQTTFCADGEEFVFSFLQCLPGGRKLIKPNTSVSFSWNGAEVISLAGQGALYILSHHNLPESEEHESPSKETLSFLSSTNSLTHQINLENDVQQLEQNVQHHRTPVVSAESLFNSIVTEHDDVNIFEDVPPLSTGSEVTTRTLAHSVDRSPESVIAELCSSVLADGVQNVKVRRNHAFQDLLRWMNRADYGWDKHLNVSFVGEQGLDSGGPRRNLMELTVRGLINWGGLWCGKEGHLIPAPDFLTLQNRSHCMAGRIVGTVLVQSSLQLNIFAESLINTIAGINQWFVEDVADETVQSKLKEILDYRGRRDWTGDPVVEKIAENISFLGEVNDAQKKDFTQAAARYYTSVVNRAQIEEFKEGLETFGIATLIRKHPDVMKLLLCGQKRATIQPDEVYDMFEAELSEVGSNQRDLEEEAMMHFMLFLSSLTNLNAACSLEDLLRFLTGAKQFPIGGYEIQPTIEFIRGSQFPTVSTCGLVLRLPIGLTEEQFKTNFEFAVRSCHDFSFV